MAETLSRGTLFPPEIVNGMFNTVKGESALAKLTGATPIAFDGNEMFTFSMDNEVNVLGENEAKPAGGVTVGTRKIVPVKIEYGARVSDEFMISSDKRRMEILRNFAEGFARKAARGLDIMAMHGLNPRSGNTSQLIQSYLDQATKTVTYTAAAPDDNVEEAVQKLGDYDMTGIAMSKVFAADLAKVKNAAGGRLYPELSWGGQPNSINGVPAAINTTVSFGTTTKDVAIVGDFRQYFKWGYAKQIPMKVIEYGDPDGTGKDLQHYNQVYLRCEAYIGFAMMDDNAFVRIVSAT